MSDIVKVQAHDLHRLLLEFRAQLERDGGPVSRRGGWRHGHDYDRSFERLADIIDAHLKAAGCDPDPRTRCQHGHPVYDWPDVPVAVDWVTVTSGSVDGIAGPRLRHLAGAPAGLHGEQRALCGFKFVDEDLAPPGTTYKHCTVCVREQRLRSIPAPEGARR